MELVRTVKYEEELDPWFVREVAAQPGGEHIWDCLQCGTCSAICPVSIYMDRSPRKIIGLIRAGFRHEVLDSVSPWICTSCYSCTVECPAGIRITDIMYIVKRMAMQDGAYHRSIVPAIEEAFVAMVHRDGRLSEGRMGLKVATRSGLRNAFSLLPTAWKLMWRGRLRLLHRERMRDPTPLQRGLAELQRPSQGAAVREKPRAAARGATA